MLERTAKSNGMCEQGQKLDRDASVAPALRTTMANDSDTDEQQNLRRWLFYLLTTFCEGAARDVSRGQARDVDDEAIVLATRLHATRPDPHHPRRCRP